MPSVWFKKDQYYAHIKHQFGDIVKKRHQKPTFEFDVTYRQETT